MIEPIVRTMDGVTIYTVNGKKHRIDGGPAEIRPGGYKAWWKDGVRHRIDGPAIEFRSGTLEWWVDGVEYYDNTDYCKAAGITIEEMEVLVLKFGDID